MVYSYPPIYGHFPNWWPHIKGNYYNIRNLNVCVCAYIYTHRAIVGEVFGGRSSGWADQSSASGA